MLVDLQVIYFSFRLLDYVLDCLENNVVRHCRKFELCQFVVNVHQALFVDVGLDARRVFFKGGDLVVE